MSSRNPSPTKSLIIGHRGASADAPENTITAFKLALEQGADGIEGDFWLGSSRQVLCFHDEDTERMSGTKLSIARASFNELRALDIGSRKGPQWSSERIPTFGECLALLPPGKTFLVELKSGPEIVSPIVNVLAASNVTADQIVFMSFHAEGIAECKRQMPTVEAWWLSCFKPRQSQPTPTPEEVAAIIKRVRADGLGAEGVPEVFDVAFIQRLKELGCGEFGVWTVDDPQVARFYIEQGAGSITTNRPGWLREQLEARSAI